MKITKKNKATEATDPGAISVAESSCGSSYSARKDFEDRLKKFKDILAIPKAPQREGAHPEIQGAGKYQDENEEVSLVPELKKQVKALESLDGFVGTIGDLIQSTNAEAPVTESAAKEFLSDGVDYTNKKVIKSKTIDGIKHKLISAVSKNDKVTYYFVTYDDYDDIDAGPMETLKEAEEFFISKSANESALDVEIPLATDKGKKIASAIAEESSVLYLGNGKHKDVVYWQGIVDDAIKRFGRAGGALIEALDSNGLYLDFATNKVDLKVKDTAPSTEAGATESIEDTELLALPKGEAYNQLLQRLRGLSYPQYISQLKQIANNQRLLDLFSTGFGDNAEITISKDDINLPVSKLLPTQNEVNLGKAIDYVIKGKEPVSTFFTSEPIEIAGPLITFNGTFIIDGHHRWAQIAILNPSAKVTCINFKSEILTPIQFLKLIQSALLVVADEVKDAGELKGVDIYRSAKKRIKEYIDSETHDEVLASLVKQLKLNDFEDARGYLFTNTLALKYNNLPAVASPNREKMPQVYDDPDSLEVVLSSPAISTAQESLASDFMAQLEKEKAVEDVEPSKSVSIDLRKVSFLDTESFEAVAKKLYSTGELRVQDSQSSDDGKDFILNVDVVSGENVQTHSLKLSAKGDIVTAVDTSNPNIRISTRAELDGTKLFFKEKV